MRYQLDSIDQTLISLLRSNGRMTNAELARQLGLSEGAIRKRVARLINEDLVRIVAVTNHYKLGYHIDTFVAIDAEIDKISSIVQSLTEMEEARYVAVTTGAYSIVCGVSFKSQEDIYKFITERLGPIPGIRKVDMSHTSKVVKRTYDWVVPE